MKFEELGQDGRVTEADVRRASDDFERAKALLADLESQHSQILKRTAVLGRRIVWANTTFRARKISDATVTRIGGFMNLIALACAILLVTASLAGFNWSIRLAISTAGAGIGALLGLSLLIPRDYSLQSSLRDWSAELGIREAEEVRVRAGLEQVGREFEKTQVTYRRVVGANEARINKLRNATWQRMTGVEFENFLGEVFEEHGYSVATTRVTGDQGVDLIVSRGDHRIAIQAKGYPNSTVGNKAIQEAHTGMVFYQCRAAVVITNSTYTSSARELAMKVGCRLIDGSLIPHLIEGKIRL